MSNPIPMTIAETGPTQSVCYPLHVVGQRPDGSYETFTMAAVPDGEGFDTAVKVCAQRKLTYVACARPRSRHY